MRGYVGDHWQTHLERALPNAISVPGLGSGPTRVCETGWRYWTG